MKTPTAPLYWLKVTDIAKGNYKILYFRLIKNFGTTYTRF